MKILHVYKDYFPVLGGIEKTVRDLAHGQVRAGHEVTVLVTHPAQSTRREVDEGVRVIRAGRLLTSPSPRPRCRRSWPSSWRASRPTSPTSTSPTRSASSRTSCSGARGAR